MHRPSPWHILGIGAIGSLWACAMHASNPRLLLSARRRADYDSTVRLKLEQVGNSCEFRFDIAGQDEAIHNLLVCTKAYAVVPALQAIASQLQPNANIVLLGNGMGYHEEAMQLFPEARLYAGSTTDGAWLNSADHVVHAGVGETQIAGYSANTDAKALVQTIDSGFLQLRTHPDANELLLQKLCINAAINGLTAIYDCRNGELRHIPDAWQEVLAICEETSSLLQAAGYRSLADSLLPRVEAVMESTAQNISSSCMDRRQKRRSEIPYFNGYLCTMAENMGRDAPHNCSVLNRVLAFEQLYD